MKQPAVYILSNARNTVLYVGVTSDISMRIETHQNAKMTGFAKRYNLYKLVYFEYIDSMEQAIVREKRLKKWPRKWKEELIDNVNPGRNDISHLIDPVY
ncbi:GIY-YIG nuclease family protein [Salinimonas lutimaris]|uniref:GIY-YIG nuclease family protein n=1 Tax=Salinimonas lutimaris TaxID=914153 RepID=UPI0010C06443|nr:GIY-YIG nuclease family protein [Salinimonas lutimaris]